MGTSCLLTARVSGWSLDPDPPARMMPFSTLFGTPEAESFALVAPGLDVFAPFAVFGVPAHGRPQTIFERTARQPLEIAPDLACIDGVAAVVSGPIGNEGLEIAIARAPGQGRIHR